jgi:hypothetical protein
VLLDLLNGRSQIRLEDKYFREEVPQGLVGLSGNLYIAFYYLVLDKVGVVFVLERK